MFVVVSSPTTVAEYSIPRGQSNWDSTFSISHSGVQLHCAASQPASRSLPHLSTILVVPFTHRIIICVVCSSHFVARLLAFSPLSYAQTARSSVRRSVMHGFCSPPLLCVSLFVSLALCLCLSRLSYCFSLPLALSCLFSLSLSLSLSLSVCVHITITAATSDDVPLSLSSLSHR